MRRDHRAHPVEDRRRGWDRRPSHRRGGGLRGRIAAGRARREHEGAESPDGGAEPDEASDERDECEDAEDAEPRQERQHPMPRRGDEPPAERERADGVAEPIQEPEGQQDTESDRDPDEERHGDDRCDGYPDQHQEAEPDRRAEAPSGRRCRCVCRSGREQHEHEAEEERRDGRGDPPQEPADRCELAGVDVETARPADASADGGRTRDHGEVPGDHIAADAGSGPEGDPSVHRDDIPVHAAGHGHVAVERDDVARDVAGDARRRR